MRRKGWGRGLNLCLIIGGRREWPGGKGGGYCHCCVGGEVAKLSTDTDTPLPSLLSSHSSSSSGFVNGREVRLEMIRIAKNAVSWTKTVHKGLEWDYLRRCILSERILVSVAPCSTDALTHPPLNEL